MRGRGDRRGVLQTLCWLTAGGLLLGRLGATPSLAADATVCRYVSQLPDDCGGAFMHKYDNLRNSRYAEIDLFARDIFKKSLYESAYNTSGLNDPEEKRDSAPQAQLSALSPKAIAKQYQALYVAIGPARKWTIDWLSDRVGGARPFGGLDARWMGYRPAAPSAISGKPVQRAYRYFSVPRTAIEGFKKGSKVYLLDDPKGKTWVMRSYTDRDLKGLTIDDLDSLADRLSLPAGWKFRTAVLAKDLILEPKSGTAGVTEDDKENVYDLTGPGQSNYTP
ncbi:MAG: hypothetical protein JO288_18615 [Hyphomicrobiales bacterium]|nr:hypothetical protein [Hyphomicrobiales bacterium]